uniref:Uncharacterized protein n=1 Tax=Arundo donax TaxID=35708 RepID=A0A0A8YYF6_ARUDO
MMRCFFVSQFVRGLKDEIRAAMQSQVPDTVDRAILLAKVQEQVGDKAKSKFQKQNTSSKYNPSFNKAEFKQPATANSLWKERQLRHYRRANRLCYYCGDKYEPAHLEKCLKRPKPQVNALAVNDLDVELSEVVLNQLAIEDTLAADFYQLSLNALAGTKEGECIKVRALVKNQVIIILIDNGSSHSFIDTSFLPRVRIQA